MMSVGHLRRSLGNRSTIMRNQSVRHNLNKVGKGKTNLKVNGSQKDHELIMQERNKMSHLTRSLMGHNMEGSRIKVMVKDNCSVGYVARSISREMSTQLGW